MKVTSAKAEKTFLFCDFCGKHQGFVEHLVTAPSGVICICCECVDVCVKSIAEQRAKESEPEVSSEDGSA